MTDRPIILLDVMETLVNEPFFTAVPEFFGMTLEALLEAKHPTSWIAFEEGRLSEHEYFNQFFRDGRPIDGAALRECLRNSYQWLDGMPKLLDELQQAGCDMHALSNYSVWYELIDERLRLSRYLQWTFVSCKTGLRKPDPQVYLHAAGSLGVEPADCLFIDDRKVNVQAARKLGMDAILRQDTESLRTALVERQIL